MQPWNLKESCSQPYYEAGPPSARSAFWVELFQQCASNQRYSPAVALPDASPVPKTAEDIRLVCLTLSDLSCWIRDFDDGTWVGAGSCDFFFGQADVIVQSSQLEQRAFKVVSAMPCKGR